MQSTGTHTLTSDPRKVIAHMLKQADTGARHILAKRGRDATPAAVEHASYVVFTALFNDTCQSLTPESAKQLQDALSEELDTVEAQA